MNLKDTILALSCIAFTLQSSAQNDADIVTPYRNGSSYIDPAPNGFEPVYIEFEEATSEAQANTKLAGFSEVYFSGAEINEILKDSTAVGIRFYNAYEPDLKDFTIVAVAIKEDGSEISSGASQKYLISTISDKTESHWKGYARTCVELCRDHKDMKHYAAFFSKSVIEDMLKESGDGIKLIPASRKFELKDKSVKTYNTMMAVGASISKGSIQVAGTAYRKSLEPCPYHCPTDDYLLAPAEYE